MLCQKTFMTISRIFALQVSFKTGLLPEIDNSDVITILSVFRNSNYYRMCANAERDSRPAEYRWCRLFNATKFG